METRESYYKLVGLCTAPQELSHHGILGMKWGKKNGPPYPLNYSDLSPEEKAQAKEKAIRNGNIKEAVVNMPHFTDTELRQLKERYSLNKAVRELAAEDIKSGMDKIDNLMKNVGKVTNWSEVGIKAYNQFAKVANSLGDSDLPVIGAEKKSKPAKNYSYDTKKLEDMIVNPDKYSDEALAEAARRMENYNKISAKKGK